MSYANSDSSKLVVIAAWSRIHVSSHNRTWPIVLNEIILKYAKFELKWFSGHPVKGLEFRENDTAIFAKGVYAMAFVDMVISRETVKTDSFVFEFEWPEYIYCFDGSKGNEN